MVNILHECVIYMKKTPNKLHAFTLIEVAITLLIIGIVASLVVPTLHAIKKYHHQQRDQENKVFVQHALVAYLAQNKRLPCPAVKDDGYAVEKCTSQNCAGIIPFATLQIPKEKTKDADGKWFVYAVEPKLTANFLHFNKLETPLVDELVVLPDDSLDEEATFCRVQGDDSWLKIIDQNGNSIVQDVVGDLIAFVIAGSRLESDGLLEQSTFIDKGNNLLWITRNTLMSAYLHMPCISSS